MICISVTPTSRRLAKVDLLNAAPRCDLIELCLDKLAKEPDVGEMISGIGKPILVSCRRKQDGGQWDRSEDERLAWLRKAIVAGPDYVELELDVAPNVPRFGETKRVVSYTSLDKPLKDVDKIFDEAKTAKADVVKFTWPTPTLNAAWPLLAAVTKKRDLPVVGMGLGRAGITFSLLGRKYGSPWIDAALEPGMEAHEGQTTVWDLADTFDCEHISSSTKLIGVVGFGDAEATVVRALNRGFQALDMNSRCLPLALGKFNKLGQMLDILKVNVLLVSPQLAPHILEFAEHTEEAAQQSGYADMLLKQKDGWHAYNIVWRSALKALEDSFGPQNDAERPLDRRNVLIVGARGMAWALCHGIRRRKGVVSVTAPNEDEARKFAQQFDIRHVPFQNVYDTLADVVVIADPNVPVGSKRTELNPSYLRSSMTVLDVCRLPADTEFLSEARERGCQVVEPRSVFDALMTSQFKSITGKPLPAEALAADE